jgi:hypothetical protein
MLQVRVQVAHGEKESCNKQSRRHKREGSLHITLTGICVHFEV